MNEKIEVEPIIRLHAEDGAYLELGTSPDVPENVQIRTLNKVSKEYFGDISLSLDIPKARQLAAALNRLCDALENLDELK